MLPTIINKLVLGYSSNTEVETNTVYAKKIESVNPLNKNNISLTPRFKI